MKLSARIALLVLVAASSILMAKRSVDGADRGHMGRAKRWRLVKVVAA